MFVSFFFPIFLGIVVTLFFVLPRKWRPVVLLLSSYIFCGSIDLRALFVLLIVSVSTWAAGILIEKAYNANNLKEAKIRMILAVLAGIVVLCIFKYTGSLLSRFHIDSNASQAILSHLMMPIGLSFYLFQAIGYVVDVYQKKSAAEKNLLYLSCYFGFFAKLVSGPIERESDFLPQLQKLQEVKFLNRGRLSSAFTYILWGYFVKMVVADRLAITVNALFDDPSQFDSFWLILGALFYTIQIYCDFAGYSYIAIGCAEIFGIKLTQNFKAPYCARSVAGFWRRWHISLSSWLRDYVYIPLGGNRRGKLRKCINVILVFLICGMWHGAGLNFIAWGLLHGFYQVAETCLLRGKKAYPGSRFVTFIAVAFAWIFFRASGLRSALAYIKYMFTAGIHPDTYLITVEKLQLNAIELIITVVGITVVWFMDELCNNKGMPFPELIQHKQNATRYFIFYLFIVAIFIFGIYGPGYQAGQFIYMQF